MGKTRGRPKKGQLVDKTILPPDDPAYELPPPEECEDVTWPHVLSPRDELRARMNLWQGTRMVEFAITQIRRDADGTWQEVARVDTCHGVVHKHQLWRGSSDTVGQRTELERIPPERGWETVDKWYDLALTLMQDGWQENLRLWGGDNE